MLIIQQGTVTLFVQVDYGLIIRLEDVSPNVPLILTFMDTRKYVTFHALIQGFMQKISPDNA